LRLLKQVNLRDDLLNEYELTWNEIVFPTAKLWTLASYRYAFQMGDNPFGGRTQIRNFRTKKTNPLPPNYYEQPIILDNDLLIEDNPL
jgi:hypothetical protein